jgi:hypothetical protein
MSTRAPVYINRMTSPPFSSRPSSSPSSHSCELPPLQSNLPHTLITRAACTVLLGRSIGSSEPGEKAGFNFDGHGARERRQQRGGGHVWRAAARAVDGGGGPAARQLRCHSRRGPMEFARPICRYRIKNLGKLQINFNLHYLVPRHGSSDSS